ncbi:MAG TPA: cell division protein FtsA, partial [Bryobacteraceae bacterium]
KENLITGIDVGTAKTCAVVAEITDHGLHYRGHGVSESQGMRKGLIVELDKAVKSVQKAVELAENAAGAPVEHAVVGIGGPHIRGVNSQGGFSLGSRAREITREDKRQAIERARAIALPADRQPVHLLPQEFIIDDQAGIHDPEGMTGRTVEVRVHVATAASTATQNLITTLNRAGIHVDDTVLEPLAAAESVLRAEERELGVCLCDIGAGSTELIVFHEGAVQHTGVVPVGGDHFTNDIAVGLRTPLSAAEQIKQQFGCAVVTKIPEGSEIEVPSVGDRPSRLMQQRLLGEILEPRSQELFEMVRENLRAASVLDLCGAGMVLTGGGARLPALADVVDTVLHWPARVGGPAALPKMSAELGEPEYAAAIGLVLYAYRSRLARPGTEPTGLRSKLRALFAKKA